VSIDDLIESSQYKACVVFVASVTSVNDIWGVVYVDGNSSDAMKP
jgi:hypothetical protein